MRLQSIALFLTLLLAPIGMTAPAQTPGVTLTPAIVEVGSPELIRVRVPLGATLNDATVDGEWLDGAGLNQKLQFFRGRDGQAWYALAGVDVKAAAGLANAAARRRELGRHQDRKKPVRNASPAGAG